MILEANGRRTYCLPLLRSEGDLLTHTVGRWTETGGTVTGAPRVEVGVLPARRSSTTRLLDNVFLNAVSGTWLDHSI